LLGKWYGKIIYIGGGRKLRPPHTTRQKELRRFGVTLRNLLLMKNTNMCICFDFDGTIADSCHLFVAKVRHLACELGYKPISQEQAEQLRSKHVRDIIKQFKFPYYRIPWLVLHLRAAMRKEMQHVAPMKGMPEVIAQLHKQRYVLGIVSSNCEKIVRDFLDRHGMQAFDFLACSSNIFGKVMTLRWVLQKQQLQPEQTVYIGDELRDAEAARKIGVRFGAVAWGYNTLESLKYYVPDYEFKTPGDIIAEFVKNDFSPDEQLVDVI
jgi:phosphoglycolate phosphatase-like HAD superfamily hydrolase